MEEKNVLGVTNSGNKRGVYRTFHYDQQKSSTFTRANDMLKVIGRSLNDYVPARRSFPEPGEHKDIVRPCRLKPNVISRPSICPGANSPQSKTRVRRKRNLDGL